MITKGKLSLMSPVHLSQQQTSESVWASLMWGEGMKTANRRTERDK